MIKCEVIEEFTLSRFNDLKNIQRKSKKEDGRLYVGDIFECDEEMAKYLTGSNPLNKTVVKVIEVKVEEPKIEEPTTQEVEPKKKTTKKTTKVKKS